MDTLPYITSCRHSDTLPARMASKDIHGTFGKMAQLATNPYDDVSVVWACIHQLHCACVAVVTCRHALVAM